MLCEYGCGNEANYILSNGVKCCSNSYNSCPAVKEKNSISCKKAYETRKRKSGKEQYKALSEEVKDKMRWNKGLYLESQKDVFHEFSIKSNAYIKQRLLNEQLIEYKCSICKISHWLGEELILELDHINGIGNDNRLENLRLLCPNCHSQTDTFRGRNKNNGATKVSDKDLLEALHSSPNIRTALIKVGLAPKGDNYSRCKRLLKN